MSERLAIINALSKALELFLQSHCISSSAAGVIKRTIRKTSLKRKATSATGAIPRGGASSCVKSTLKPTSQQLKTLFVASAVPMDG